MLGMKPLGLLLVTTAVLSISNFHSQGRSPYDDIVQGEGDSDPWAPLQLYDERGRPVNPETKRINKDVIRSHNEVMLVIGVAEAENDTSDAQADSARRHDQYEQKVGETMFYVSTAIETTGVWGVNGMRQRIMVGNAINCERVRTPC